MYGLSLGTRASYLKSVALTVLELLAFNSHCAHTHRQTDAHTSNEHIISTIHFVHLAEIINYFRTEVSLHAELFSVLSNCRLLYVSPNLSGQTGSMLHYIMAPISCSSGIVQEFFHLFCRVFLDLGCDNLHLVSHILISFL